MKHAVWDSLFVPKDIEPEEYLNSNPEALDLTHFFFEQFEDPNELKRMHLDAFINKYKVMAEKQYEEARGELRDELRRKARDNPDLIRELY